MIIKDVEKLTGLTAKSIRYYESKNLISIARNEENDYRDYTEEDVFRLKWIKLLRYLDFSIEEISRLLTADEKHVSKALRMKADTFSKRKETCQEKQDLCFALAADYTDNSAVIEEYNDTIAFLESDENKELMEEIEDALAPSLTLTIIQTLVYMAPVFGLFYNIKTARIDLLMTNAVLAIVCTALATGTWVYYITQYRKHRERVKRKAHSMKWTVLLMLLSIFLGLFFLAVLEHFVLEQMLPEDYLFQEENPVASTILVWVVMIPAILCCSLAVGSIGRKSVEETEEATSLLFFWNHLGKWRAVVVVIWLIVLYGCLTSFNAVTADKIICYTPWNPTGTAYAYSDVESIKTGFGDKNAAIVDYKRKGNFYYQIEIDGKTITFHVPCDNEDIQRYMEDSYLELEEFDQALVNLGIPKEADAKGWKNCDLDHQYVERFLRIIELKQHPSNHPNVTKR